MAYLTSMFSELNKIKYFILFIVFLVCLSKFCFSQNYKGELGQFVEFGSGNKVKCYLYDNSGFSPSMRYFEAISRPKRNLIIAYPTRWFEEISKSNYFFLEDTVTKPFSGEFHFEIMDEQNQAIKFADIYYDELPMFEIEQTDSNGLGYLKVNSMPKDSALYIERPGYHPLRIKLNNLKNRTYFVHLHSGYLINSNLSKMRLKYRILGNSLEIYFNTHKIVLNREI